MISMVNISLGNLGKLVCSRQTSSPRHEVAVVFDYPNGHSLGESEPLVVLVGDRPYSHTNA